MKGEILSREIVESIVRSSNDEYMLATDEKVRNLVAVAIEELSGKIPFVSFNNVVFQPINELLTGGFSDNSVLEYFLGVDNAQLDINCHKSEFWRNVKRRVVFAWKNRNANKKRRFRKKKKEEPRKLEKFEPETYNINSLARDLQSTLLQYLTNTTVIYLDKNCLKIVGKDDFGANTQIIIHVVLYDGANFKYVVDRKKMVAVDLENRISAINDKYEMVGENFSYILKVFNTLYYNINKAIPNQIFVESLICNCPNSLFTDDFYNTFLKVVNFLTMSDVKMFRSIANPDKTVFQDELCGNSAPGYMRFKSKLISMK